MELTILYRGPLSSCNYACQYCPFAKRHETAAELRRDRAALERFVQWVADRREDRLAVFFTPWGEGLVRPWYRDALMRLTKLPHVAKAAIQTNLSCRLDWVGRCAVEKLGLWCTWHPGQVARRTFLEQCRALDDLGARYSVGIVGLPAGVYLWVNAYKDQPDYYTENEVRRWQEIDPLFAINNTRHPSLGRACRTGETVISVDGAGAVRRCHFIRQPLGNIYEPGWERALVPRPCTNATCGCHIGYVHLEHLRLERVFGGAGEGLLERIPAEAMRSGNDVPRAALREVFTP
jgi:hypothetical protein